jgi:hypothetical protein
MGKWQSMPVEDVLSAPQENPNGHYQSTKAELISMFVESEQEQSRATSRHFIQIACQIDG